MSGKYQPMEALRSDLRLKLKQLLRRGLKTRYNNNNNNMSVTISAICISLYSVSNLESNSRMLSFRIFANLSEILLKITFGCFVL